MTARIYREDKPPTQSGFARTERWNLAFEPQDKEVEPLMGWTSSADTRQQVHLAFASKEEAVAYATRNGIAYRVEEPHESRPKPLSYSDNFKFNRVSPWTH